MNLKRWEIERKGGGAYGERWEAKRKGEKKRGDWEKMMRGREKKRGLWEGEKGGLLADDERGEGGGWWEGETEGQWEDDERGEGQRLLKVSLGLGFFLFILAFFLRVGMVESVRFGSIGFEL